MVAIGYQSRQGAIFRGISVGRIIYRSGEISYRVGGGDPLVRDYSSIIIISSQSRYEYIFTLLPVLLRI